VLAARAAMDSAEAMMLKREPGRNGRRNEY